MTLTAEQQRLWKLYEECVTEGGRRQVLERINALEKQKPKGILEAGKA